MTAKKCPECDCPEPCQCYEVGRALGQYQALPDFISSIDGDPPHAQGCGCWTCYFRRAWDQHPYNER